MKHLFCFLGLIIWPLLASAQTKTASCDIKQRVEAGGSMIYYMEPERFYWTPNKSLDGAIVTDKDRYFLTLLPRPFPAKDGKKEISKDDLDIVLSNGNDVEFSFYDSYYVNDSTFIMMYVIDKEHIEELRKYDVEKITIHVSKEEDERVYHLKLHKAAFREQLNCFFKRD